MSVAFGWLKRTSRVDGVVPVDQDMVEGQTGRKSNLKHLKIELTDGN